MGVLPVDVNDDFLKRQKQEVSLQEQAAFPAVILVHTEYIYITCTAVYMRV